MTFFTRLMEAEGTSTGPRTSHETLMSSHPATYERIRDVERLIAATGVTTGRTEQERFDDIRSHLRLGYRGKWKTGAMVAIRHRARRG